MTRAYRNLIPILSALILLVVAQPISRAWAQSVQTIQTSQAWFPQSRLAAAISVTTSSAATALPTTGQIAWLCNTGANDVYLAFGTSNAITVTLANGYWLKSLTCGAYGLFPRTGLQYTHVAAIGSGGASTLLVEAGLGSPPPGITGSSGAAVSDATAANQVLQLTQATATNTVLGLQADAASSAGGAGTLSAKLRLMTTQLGTINTTLGTPMQATGGTVGLVAGVAEIGNVKNSGTFAVQATLTAETTKVIGVVRTADGSGNLLTSTAQALDVNIKSGSIANTGFNVTGTLPAFAAIPTFKIDQTTPGTTNLVALAANQSVNAAQINGVTPLMGNGGTGTGSLRVTVASDNTAFSVNATLGAETTKVIGVVRNADGAGNLLTVGHGTAAAALRVELPTDGTGVVGLNSGSAIVGKFGIDQTTPGTTNLVAAGQNGTWTVQPGNTPNTTPWLTTNTPSSSAGSGVAHSTAVTAAESCRVLKASAGNLYSLRVAIAATPGYIMVFDAASAPGDGAVTTLAIPAVRVVSDGTSGWYGDDFNPPLVMATGITVCFSSTGPFSKTASATAAIGGQAQ